MIHIVIGTKAQLIKMAPVMKSLMDEGIEYNYISTGQHRETIDEILDNFGIKGPDITLYHGKDITSVVQMFFWATRIAWRSLFKRREIFRGDRNGIVLVHGDTFSTLLGAIMGKFGGLNVGHVESGLRSFNIFHPFPEELTRLMTFRLSDVMFCPGQWAIDNLERHAGIKVDTGLNTLFDSLQHALPAIHKIEDLDVPFTAFGLVTLHRFENIRDRDALERILSLVERISSKKKLLFVLHKPTKEKLERHGLLQRLQGNPNIETRPRYDYFKFIRLVLAADFLVSDGGSNQEECYYLGKPVLLLRKATERPEGLGRNCVLSEYRAAVIDEFVANVEKYRSEIPRMDIAPSMKIIDFCRPYA